MAKKTWKDSKNLRTLRRFAIIFIISGAAGVVTYLTNMPNKTMTIILATSIAAAAEKYIREYFAEKKQ